MKRFDKRAFRRWLAAHPPGTGVGAARSPDGCPLAVWLSSDGRDPVGGPGVTVDEESALDRMTGRRRLLPHWAWWFVATLDGRHDGDCVALVSREEALVVLDVVEGTVR